MSSVIGGIIGAKSNQGDGKIPGFFPTSKRVGEIMISVLDLRPGKSVLEPSAGDGALLDLLPDHVQKYCSEINPVLRKLLTQKGYFPRGDFFAEEPGPGFDNVLMNPPFEDGKYIAHIHHAFLFLKYGGRLVSLIPDADTHFASNDTLPVERGSTKKKGYVPVRILVLERRKDFKNDS